MKQIPLDQIPEEFNEIQLQNGKIAKLYSVSVTIIPDIDPNKETIVYRYSVPCPICDTENNGAYSYDGVYFANTQMCCSHCGIYYRPIKKRN